jgi:predicted alpha/beta-fold hydrolase
VSITQNPTQADRKARVMAELERHPFQAPWWLRGRHGQTVWSHFLRRPTPPPLRRERLDTPDGDFLDLYLADGDPDSPTVLLLHGLEGSVRSNYIAGLQAAFHTMGWRSAALQFRSCGGEMNRACRMYHSGETTDLAFAVDFLVEREPDRRICIAGFSLGGNVAAKWLGEDPDRVPPNVQAAAVVSTPFDLAGSAAYFERSLGGLYSRRFLRSLIPKALEKARQYPGILDAERIRRSRSFADFDTWATAALHGFRDAEDYWAQSSSAQFLPNIRIPTLLISAEDDPFNPPWTLPRPAAAESPFLHPLFPDKGGHVGFVYGPTPFQARRWAEEQIVRFFRLYKPSPHPEPRPQS